MANNGNGGGGFVLGLFVGGTIGALLGLLLAPRSGSETRAELRELGDTWRTRADELAADVRGYGMSGLEDVSGRVGPAVDSLRERGSSALGISRKAKTDATEEVEVVSSGINVGDGHQPAQATQTTATDTEADAEAETATDTEADAEAEPTSDQQSPTPA